jgi:predicted DCC family thiol-disulfide oxidoreductase YuxK
MDRYGHDIEVPEILLSASEKHPIIIYDGECILCNRFVQFLLNWDKHQVFRFTHLQTVEQKELYDTVYFLHKRKLHAESDAAIMVLSFLGFPWNLFKVFSVLPQFLRNGVYRFISRNRYRWFGKKDSCFMPSEMGDRFLKL